MRTHLAHVQLNIDPENSAFYRELFGLLGWPVIYEGDGFFGFGGAGKDSIWFHEANASTNDYDGPGMNQSASVRMPRRTSTRSARGCAARASTCSSRPRAIVPSS
ncbi:MAG: hypothetical protein AB7I38_14860 [Dehalococcoidia bacterium]